MDMSSYVRRPFEVGAIQVTRDNIEDIAREIGTLKRYADGTPYISVDKRKIRGMWKVQLGYWYSRTEVPTPDGVRVNHRCYTPEVFAKQYVSRDDTPPGVIGFLETTEEPSDTAVMESALRKEIQSVFDQPDPSDVGPGRPAKGHTNM